ncbi:exonuclease domain-containing protein [Stygiobacter electus]|uniref:Exonuclease domain-containing protein n=1 Tax=Stygiobacter electus TaxID=3032292 RepID=A0AAE3P073_9BACT|nr:exonuclease domain-containing protein [Stygiobacter electus]MDF1611855.1 exonuclease domain-containing protein [Stygiobacter electus]
MNLIKLPVMIKKEIEIKEIPFEEAEYSVFDFETTGTSAKFENVIQIGIVRIKNKKIVDTFSSYINPGKPIPYFITTLTGITNSDVENAPYFDEVYQKIKNFVSNSVLVAHNLSFDFSFLKYECLRFNLKILDNPAICTLKLAKRIFPDLQSKSLGSLVKFLKIKHRDVHTGLGDATATAKVFLRMFEQLKSNFDIYTVDDLIKVQSFSSNAKSFRIIKKNLVEDFLQIPDLPGVYFFKDARDKIIYIGKAKSLKERVKNYFSNNAVRKAKKIVQQASKLDFIITNSELSALIAETELIKVHNPKFNVLLKKYPNNYFIRINKNNIAKVEPATKFEFDGNDYFGPYPNRLIVHKLKDIIDQTFQIRECNDKELKKKRKCYLYDIKRCLAPCINYEFSSYNEELEKIYDFLNGNNQSAVNRLLLKMKLLSEQKKYEEAAEIRDLVQNILNQIHKTSILSEPLNKAKVLIEIDSHPKSDFLLLIDGKVFIKNFFLENKNDFDYAIDDYFSGTISINESINETNLERLKISLTWLLKNKTRIKIHYLRNYKTKEELAMNLFYKNYFMT